MANATRLALGAVVGDGDVGEEGEKEEASTLEVGVLSLSTRVLALIDAETSVDGDPGSDDPAMIVDSSDPFVEVTDDSVD